jgi:SAM-dependent methyltransferase
VSDPTFTGERLHAGSELFRLDLARHQVAYEFARTHMGAGWVLDLGCGSGYGTASLAQGSAPVAGLDRVAPDAANRLARGHFVRADLDLAIPFARRSFELVVSFQVIEHLEDPTDELAERLRPRFGAVELRGVGATDPVRRVLEARSRRIRRIMRLDPLRLRERLPRGLVEWLFARLAVLVRSGAKPPDAVDEMSWRDFPVGPADDRCLDLLAICRQPR